ncbi:MAG TPA: ribonuclease P protein component [Beijerinckiaceae bacterium]|nr:ribonuclease P protein component [Beijerinckiaceae bacterium]
MRDPCARPIGGAAPGRLTKRREFLAAASGRRFHTERMTVQGLVRDDASGLRFGLTVTKKVGHATERNRIRRRLRQAFRHAAVDHGGRNADVVVIGRRAALTADYPRLVDDLQRALVRVTTPKPVREAPPPADILATGSHHA